MVKLNGDDSNSTQLEGKKLKNRGAYMEGQLLEIEKDSPALMEEQEIEQGQEYFTDRELQKEDKGQREERLKREMAAARIQQQEQQKQQQQPELTKTLDQEFARKELGMAQSRNKNEKTVLHEFDQHKKPADERAAEQGAQQKKTDMPAATALLGDNARHMESQAGQAKDKSIPAQMLPDMRGGGRDSGLGM